MKQKFLINNISAFIARACARLGIFVFNQALLTNGLFLIVLLSFPPSFVDATENPNNQKTSNEIRPLTFKNALQSQNKVDRALAIESIKADFKNINRAGIRAAKRTENDPLVRHRLNQALVASAEDGMVAELLFSLESDESSMVRQGAAQELGNFVSDPLVVQALGRAVEKEVDPGVRYACALSIGLATSTDAFGILDQLSRDSDPNIRRQIAYGLTRNPSREAKKLLKKLSRDGDDSVRRMSREIP